MVIDTLADAEIIDYYEEVDHNDYVEEKQAVCDEHVFDKADSTTELQKSSSTGCITPTAAVVQR